ncbi:MAG: carboxypeptidase-like regulatory domain-containing protein, partial [Paludibacteraceae bacterium]|nr:carboxypeptidase-like regulatory domain-containing protein [Paludibacteraceae bacterium]
MSKSKTFEILTLSIVLFFGSLLNVFSQAIENGNDHNKYYKISGNITSNDGPIPYAYVSIEELQMNTVADGNGHFEFKRIPVGTYKIETQNLGYVDAKKIVTVANGDININIKLKNAVYELEQVTVMAKQAQRNKLEVNETAI